MASRPLLTREFLGKSWTIGFWMWADILHVNRRVYISSASAPILARLCFSSTLFTLSISEVNSQHLQKQFLSGLNSFCPLGSRYSVALSCPTLCNPRGRQHARLPCPSPSPDVCLSSHPFHPWCHPDISPFDAFFSFCPQSFPASGTFPISHLFASNDQNTRASASASVLPMSIQDWFPLGLTGLI